MLCAVVVILPLAVVVSSELEWVVASLNASTVVLSWSIVEEVVFVSSKEVVVLSYPNGVVISSLKVVGCVAELGVCSSSFPDDIVVVVCCVVTCSSFSEERVVVIAGCCVE